MLLTLHVSSRALPTLYSVYGISQCAVERDLASAPRIEAGWPRPQGSVRSTRAGHDDALRQTCDSSRKEITPFKTTNSKWEGGWGYSQAPSLSAKVMSYRPHLFLGEP